MSTSLNVRTLLAVWLVAAVAVVWFVHANLLDRLTRQNDRLTTELQHRARRDVERSERMLQQVEQARLGWSEHTS